MKFQNILIAAGILLILTIVFSTDYKKIYLLILQSNKSYLLISVLLISAGIIIRSGKLYIILNLFSTVPPSHCFNYYLNSSILSVIIPAHLGETAVAALIKKNENIEFTKIVPLLFADKLLDMAVLFIYFILSLNLLFHINLSVTNILFFLIFLSALILLPKSLLTSNVPMIQNLKYGFTSLQKTPRKLFHLTALTFIGWLPEFLSFYFTLLAFNIDPSYIQLILLRTSSIFAGILSMIPGGIGSAELSLSLLSQQFGFNTTQIMASALVYRFVTYTSLAIMMFTYGKNINNS